MTSNKTIVREFWQLLDAGEFEEAGNLLKPNAIIRWWNFPYNIKSIE